MYDNPGYGSVVVNGQLVAVPTDASFSPESFGQDYTGPSFPYGGSYNVPPVPPAPGTWETTPFLSSGVTGGNGDGSQAIPTAGAMSQDTGKVNFLHPTKSPVVFALIALVIGMLLLTFIHFR